MRFIPALSFLTELRKTNRQGHTKLKPGATCHVAMLVSTYKMI